MVGALHPLLAPPAPGLQDHQTEVRLVPRRLQVARPVPGACVEAVHARLEPELGRAMAVGVAHAAVASLAAAHIEVEGPHPAGNQLGGAGTVAVRPANPDGRSLGPELDANPPLGAGLGGRGEMVHPAGGIHGTGADDDPPAQVAAPTAAPAPGSGLDQP